MANERFWAETNIGESLGTRQYCIRWEEQELRLVALDNHHPWFWELSPYGSKLLDPFILIRLAPQLVREAFPYREGGVYSRYEVELHRPLPWDATIKVTGVLADKYEKRGGKYVRFEVSFLDNEDRLAMRVNFHTLLNVSEVVGKKKGAR